ncbi:exportin-4-like [Photinus pyralis]|uniref:Exportin-4 n=2 Tax=Photinus pyralis TaxID=7054 RepID=A0A1Y1LR33_PHOPY|nr:exportin-4-like [Photinus pyralis]
MNMDIIRQLEAAASVIMAPPNIITAEQRRSAENVFLTFRKTKLPYDICRQILEHSQVDYVLFEAAEILKSALIREWVFLRESDTISLRQYLIQYVSHRVNLPFYVQERLLQVIAIMVKRGSVEDFGQERTAILTDIENLIISGDHAKKIMGCNLIMNIMQEYASTIKSTDVGLPWEVHFKAKKQFEVTDLRKIFKFCVQLLSEIIKNEAFDENSIKLMEHLLLITAAALTWGFISPMLPRRLIGVYESVYESDQSPSLRLGIGWKEVMLAPQLLPLMFEIYWKVRDYEVLLHHTLICLVQLASLNGGVLTNDDARLQYLSLYLDNFQKILRMINANFKEKEVLGISNIVKKIQLFFGKDLSKLPQTLQDLYLNDITQITCCFAEGAKLEEAQSADDKYYVEAFDNMLEAWTSVFQDYSNGNDNIYQSATRIFNSYLQCHLAPPEGSRMQEKDNEEIEDNEDNDRIKFKDQLQIIGMFGRMVPLHCLPILFRLLEDRGNKLKSHLQAMQTYTMTLNDSKALDNLFEDIHWIILIAGHILCMDSDGETPMIPSEIMQYSIGHHDKNESTLEATLKVLASVGEVAFEVEGINQCDHAIRIFSDVLKLCVLESSAGQVKLGHFMSPEVGCTLMWFLKRWCVSYLLPTENFYQEISPTLIGALGRDTDGAIFVINFVLGKIQTNICQFTSEPILLQDTVDLFTDIVALKQKSMYFVKTEGLWNLVNLQRQLKAGSLPPNIRRGLYKSFVLAGSSLADIEALNEYYQRILKPIQLRFKEVLCQENFNRIYQEEHIKTEIIDILECFIGIAKGVQMSTAQTIFEYVIPVLSELPSILSLYRDYQVIVQLILELFGQCARHSLCYLNYLDSESLYEVSMATVVAYARCNLCRLTAEASEENSFQDLILVLELLTLVLSKECLDLCPQSPNQAVKITAADVSLFGLKFILPLIKVELLMYPALCSQYFKLIVLINDLYPDKISNLDDHMLTQLLESIKLGLTTGFGTDILQACLDFIQTLGTHIYRNSLQNSKVYQALMPFLKLLMNLTLSHEISSDMLTCSSVCIYTLICCYSDQYQALVEGLINTQTDPLVADRLATAFTQLTSNIQLNCERQPKLKFRDNFDKFIANVHGFLLVK